MIACPEIPWPATMVLVAMTIGMALIFVVFVIEALDHLRDRNKRKRDKDQ